MSKETSAIRYSLKANKLPSVGAPFVAQVHGYKTVRTEQLVARMANMNTTVSRQDIVVVLDLLKEAMLAEILDGNRVITDLFAMKVSITGGFESKTDEFQRGVHTIKVNTSPTREFRNKVAERARTEKVRGTRKAPEPDSVYDFTSHTTNRTLSPGGTVELKGANLNGTGTDPREGLYLKREGADGETKVQSIHRLTANTVLFNLPAELESGNYTLLVRSGHGTIMREGKLEHTVSVN
jgi:hypothetical protein